MNDLVTISGLSKAYGHFMALNNLNLNIPRGRIIGLLGPNGSGKTTFFRWIMGLAAPQEGRILFHGRPLETEKDFRELRCKVGLVLQHAEDQLFCPTVL